MRIVLKAPDPLQEWPHLEDGVCSALNRVECYRAIERLWRDGDLSDENAFLKRREVETILGRLQRFPVSDDVLKLAADPLPTHLKTLDALHLATAILFRRSPAAESQRILFATHDKLLAKAARELHFEVIGA